MEESTKYLGRKVCHEDPHQREFDNRIAKAWGAFSRHKKELTDKRHRLRDRLKLFDAIITPTVLYGCESWALRVDQQKRLRTLQRKMLRMVLNAKRPTISSSSSSTTDEDKEEGEENEAKELEPWQVFLKRTARWTEDQLDKANLQQWTAQWRKRKWTWAAKLLERGNRKWSSIATMWQPLLHGSGPCGRRQARPKRRWEQDFLEYLQATCPNGAKHWQELAADRKWWVGHTEAFASWHT